VRRQSALVPRTVSRHEGHVYGLRVLAARREEERLFAEAA
jgi:hypothetical protein